MGHAHKNEDAGNSVCTQTMNIDTQDQLLYNLYLPKDWYNGNPPPT